MSTHTFNTKCVPAAHPQGRVASRLPRFKRDPTVPPLYLTERDRRIIRLVHTHRFLRSSHIVALLGGSSQQLVRRLQLLYHHGFLERPRAQLDYYHTGGSRHIVYGLGSKGAGVLTQELGQSCDQLRWGEKNRAVGRVFLEHALLVSDIMVAIELACQQSGRVRLLTGPEIPVRGNEYQPPSAFRWQVTIDSGIRLGVVPDRVFELEFLDESRKNNPALFFLEADRGTMPVTRSNLTQTSFYRKLLAYESTWSQSIHRTQFGFHRFRVLTVTTGSGRLQSLVQACSDLKRGHNLFLFGDRGCLENPAGIFASIWQTGRPGENASLLD